MKNNIYFLLIALFFAAINMNSQSDNSVNDLLNRTEISIYKAQKEMIAGNSPKKVQELSLSIKCQVLAIDAFKNNDSKLAVCYSLKSREYSNDILVQMILKGIENYLLNSSEIQLAKQYNFNTQDEIYRSNVSQSLIDESILFNPQKLGTSYKITIN